MIVAKKVLIVEDEDTIRQTLKYNLGREGHVVKEAATGTDGVAVAREWRPDLIILDLMLPGLNGLEMCRLVREEMTVPILMLTAKASELDKIVGLQVGADDYMTKPFSLNELLARVSALLRGRELAKRQRVAELEVEEFDGFRFDRSGRTVHVDGKELRLAPKEFDLLSFLLMNAGKAQSRQIMIRHVWGNKFYGDPKTVDVHIRWLREKFEAFERLPFRINTVFGVGYRLDKLDEKRVAAV